MTRKTVPPSISLLAFDCPHCGAYTSHKWFEVQAWRIGDGKVPYLLDADALEAIKADGEIEAEHKSRMVAEIQRQMEGLVVLEGSSGTKYGGFLVGNVHLSECFTCRKVAVWLRDRLVVPATMHGPLANPDLPDDVVADYNEAGRIVAVSPRGAAALLRLSIQKLCIALGEKGKNIDDDIASLVKKGLAPLVQQALDVVRVIGNEAVHPGTLDLKDDVGTATKLFGLVNLIAEQMISNPKHVKELYDSLPESKRQGIEQRDGKAVT